MPIVVIINMIISKRLDDNYYLVDEYFGKMMNSILNILEANKTIRIYGAERFIEAKLRNQLNSIQKESYVNNNKITKATHKVFVLNFIPTIIHLILGGIFVINNIISIGEFISIGLLRGYISVFLNYIPNILPKYHAFIASINRIIDIIKIDINNDKIKYNENIESLIICNNIFFSYGENVVIDNYNMCFQENRMTAIIGKSGSGKSTLLKIIAGLYEPDLGEVLTKVKN